MRDQRPDAGWQQSRPEPLLEQDVHLWRVYLDQPRPVIEDLWQVLEREERRRAGRFAFEHLRTRYVIARGALRTLLGRYLQTDPARIEFCYNEQGKPFLAASAAHFNLSHSQDLCVIAIAQSRALGVDIEQVRTLADRDQLAARFFSGAEYGRLRSLNEHERDEAFFQCWTRKEAYIKAIGQGLSLPLDGFQVSFGPGVQPALLSVEEDAAEAARWKLIHVDPAPGYIGALIAAGQEWSLQQFHFMPDEDDPAPGNWPPQKFQA